MIPAPAILPADDEIPDVQLGCASDAAPDSATVPVEEKPEPEPPVTLYSDARQFEGYSRTPTYMDQYERLPATVKEGELTAEIFDLQDPAHMKTYQKRLGEATNPYSPRIIVSKTDTITHDGHWKVLVHYKPLWYKVLHR
jgi:hypothetical protein